MMPAAIPLLIEQLADDDSKARALIRLLSLIDSTSGEKRHTIQERIEAWNRNHNLSVPQQIDAVFILTGGSIINFGTGVGTLQYITPEGKSLPGYIFHDPKRDRPLVSLLT